MAAGAGSLGLALGGPASITAGSRATATRRRPAGRGEDIAPALTLVRRSMLLWLACSSAGGWLRA
jgi:cobalamin biosynthesis protein CobD/CbiB